jgi:hypothetical protein
MMGNGFISLKHTTFGGESSSGKLEDTKGVTRSRKSKKDRQQNAQEKKILLMSTCITITGAG